MFVHEITLDGYAAQCAEQPIRLGTAGSYGVETLSVMRKGEWVDYDIIVAFHPPKGETVQIRLGSDNVVSVPAEATAVVGTGELTFAGYTDGVRQISVSQIYRVAASAGAEGIAPAEPTPDVVQQILSAATEAANKAEQAEETAQSVRDDADAGKFNGAQGPKGDTGPAVALDTTLTHEDEAADAKATGDAISAVKARQNILVGSETGNPVAVDDAFAAPLCGLTVYGKSTQDGTPSPDAPVPIVSAGDGGTIAVTLSDGHGKTQTLTLPTLNGLPGIPVTSGGNYTDPQGQQWVCDEIDSKKEVKVQRVGKEQVNTADGEVNEQYRLALNNPGSAGKDGSFPCFLSITPYTTWTSCVSGTSIYLKNIAKFDGSFYTAEELKALAIDVDFVYQLDTPIETPLTPAEIAAYKALTAYAPDTVVQASDGAGIKLDYQRDVNIVIKKLEDAIASIAN